MSKYNRFHVYNIGQVLERKYSNILILKTGKNGNSKNSVKCYDYKCLKCNQINRNVIEYTLKKGGGCPVCSGNVVVKGVNDIATTHPKYVGVFCCKKDAETHTYGSTKKIKFSCPDCGEIKETIFIKLLERGFNCCGDGKSYPEKYVRNFLRQSGVEYTTEYQPKWAGKRRYDFYLPILNTIIEVHGFQHYNGGFEYIGGKNLEYEVKNDKFKYELAKENGIENYIIIDCRKSEHDWIMDSILNNQYLSKIVDFDIIDFKQCAEYATSNVVRHVCNVFNECFDMSKTSELTGVCLLTVRSYLKRGKKLGWCSYTSGELRSARHEFSVYCETTGITYDTTKCAIDDIFKKHGVLLKKEAIRNVCKKRINSTFGFMFDYANKE